MITLVLGGARSGKSSYAESLASRAGGRVVYLATAEACDGEMARRIAIHRERRDAAWTTWEGEPPALPSAVAGFAREECTMLLDCATVWLSRMMFEAGDPDDEAEWQSAERGILSSLGEIFAAAAGSAASLIVVSNEVGLSLVPPYRLGRRFRDLQGRANQFMASAADDVVFVAAGLPLPLKRGGKALYEKPV